MPSFWYEVGALSTIYLGLPLGAKSMSMEIWNGVIEKCEKKLARWKSQYLSMGERLTLINSVLDALPTYMMSLFPIPPGIINRLDIIRRNFYEKDLRDWGSRIWEIKIKNLMLSNLLTSQMECSDQWEKIWGIGDQESEESTVIQMKIEVYGSQSL